MTCDHCGKEINDSTAFVIIDKIGEKSIYQLCEESWTLLHNNFFLRLELERKNKKECWACKGTGMRSIGSRPTQIPCDICGSLIEGNNKK